MPPLDQEQLARLGDTVCVWAHPDDETYLAGGVMAALRDAGHRVVCVTATRGELGGQAPPEVLRELRTRELECALAVLGVHELRWLDVADGCCEETDARGPVAGIAEVLREVRPRTVLTFARDGMTGHPDHRAVSAWTSEAFGLAAPAGSALLHAAVTADDITRAEDVDRRLGVLVGEPPPATPDDELAVRAVLDGSLLARKLRALEALRSQTAWARSTIGPVAYEAWVRTESFRPAT